MAFFPANFMLQTSQDQEDEDGSHNHQEQQHSIFPPQYDFNGKRTMLLSGRMEQCTGCEDTNNEEDELQKNRRLNMEQLQTLEKSFEMGKRLEPERKMQLARALGLQPRQIVIWFQNRRARWKTKQLEKDYDALKTQFDAVKARNEALQAQNQKLQSQILRLTSGGEVTE